MQDTILTDLQQSTIKEFEDRAKETGLEVSWIDYPYLSKAIVLYEKDGEETFNIWIVSPFGVATLV